MDFPAASALVGVESRDELNKPPRKMRSACDRCHLQKLRCIKKQGELSCERCLKLHTLCRFGPRAPRASLRPQRRGAPGDWYEPSSMPVAIPMQNEHSNPAMTFGDSSEWHFPPDVDLDFIEVQGIPVTPITGSIHLPTSCVSRQDNINPVATMRPEVCYPIPKDLEDMHNFCSDSLCELANANSLDQYGSLDFINQDKYCNTFPLRGTFNDRPRVVTSPASTIKKLATLNIALYDCAAKLPSAPEMDENTAETRPHGHGTQKRMHFSFDELFRLTSEFIDIITCPSCVTCDSNTISPTEDFDPANTEPLLPATGQQQLLHMGPDATATGSRKFISYVDGGTLLMIVSCHYRLTEVYLSIFQMMQACIKFSVAPQQKRYWAVALPQYQVSSCVVSPLHVDANTLPLSSSTTSMYMTMITMLSSQLCEKLAGMMQLGDQDITNNGGGREFHSREKHLGKGDEGYVSLSQPPFAIAVADRTNRLHDIIETTKHLFQRFSFVTEQHDSRETQGTRED